RDAAASTPVVVVNDTFARRFLPGPTPIDQVVDRRTVIAVVDDQLVLGGYKTDGRARTWRDAAPPMIYVPLAQSSLPGPSGSAAITISVRFTAGSPSLIAPRVASALHAVNGDIRFTIRTLDDVV